MFLNFALHKIYNTPLQEKAKHTVKSLEAYPKILFPIRNPIDSIASFLEDDLYEKSIQPLINYYLRFMNAALSMEDKLCVLEFEKFKDDLDYLTNSVYEFHNIEPVNKPTIQEVKDSMLELNYTHNLPMNNQEHLSKMKEVLNSHNVLDQCYEVYNKLSNR